MQERQVTSLDWEDSLEKEMATHSRILAEKSHGQRNLVGYSPDDLKELDPAEPTEWDVPGSSAGTESPCKGDLGLIPGLGRSPGGRHGHPPQYSCLENPHGQRCLVGYGLWDCKDLDMTERLRTHSRSN